MWLKSLVNNRKKLFILILFGAIISGILWFTLFSRNIKPQQCYFIPLYSYIKGIQGNWMWLIENMGNVIMFIPLGMMLRFIVSNRNKSVLIAFLFSLLIEIVQITVSLGCFEVDDIIHNTLGAAIGISIFQSKLKSNPDTKRLLLKCLALTVIIFLCGGFYKMSFEIRNCKRIRDFAAVNDSDNYKNLLLLDCKNGHCGNSNVYVKYLDDGSISISGSSDIRSWFLLGQQQLEPGIYQFAGLSDVERGTVAIQLEFKNDQNIFVRLTDDIGPIDAEMFTVTEPTQIRAYVGIYPGCDCDVIARPVIFKLGE